MATGSVERIGSMEHGRYHRMQRCQEPLPVKILLHPLRRGHGGPPFVPWAFEQAVQRGAATSQAWGLGTALWAITSGQECLDPADYPDPASRAALLRDLHKCWASQPICTSVPILVWQTYFEIACSGAGVQGLNLAVQHILEWVPLLSDQTTPSGLLQALTKRGWILRGNLDT